MIEYYLSKNGKYVYQKHIELGINISIAEISKPDLRYGELIVDALNYHESHKQLEKLNETLRNRHK